MNLPSQPAHTPPETPHENPQENRRRPRRRGGGLVTTAVAALTSVALVGSLTSPASGGSARTGVTSAAPAAAGVSTAGAARVRGARFQLATFNILGSNHTRNSRRYARGTVRARIAARVIKARGTDVVTLQEVQDDQLRVLRNNLGGYGIWPRQRLGNNGVRLQIAWRKRRFAHLGHGHITTTFSHQQRPIPWVKLRDRRSGAQFFVIDIHNSPGRQERARDRATYQEIRLIKRLRRRSGGKPVFIAGDANEHFEFFCKVGRATALRAPQGGNPDARPCRKPRNPRLLIDWIMGGGRINFKYYSQVRTPRVRRASDHHYVQTGVWVGRRVG